MSLTTRISLLEEQAYAERQRLLEALTEWVYSTRTEGEKRAVQRWILVSPGMRNPTDAELKAEGWTREEWEKECREIGLRQSGDNDLLKAITPQVPSQFSEEWAGLLEGL